MPCPGRHQGVLVFVLDRSRRARVQKLPRLVAVVVSFALLATALQVREPAVAAPAADPKPSAAKVTSRPDLMSAVLTARSHGSKVEVESLRTETSTTWANPDGTMTTDAHMAPIRFKTAKGTCRSGGRDDRAAQPPVRAAVGQA